MSHDPMDRIREQFTRQGAAYAKLEYVSHAKGLKAILAMAEASQADRVLDVACGPGFIAMAFAEVCAEVVGVDATDSFLQMAREESKRRNLQNLRFVEGDVTQMEFEDNAFDIAVCRAAFHHFPDPASVLHEMKRVVRPGGRLLVMDMLASEDPDKAAYHQRLEVLCDPTHAKALSPSAFESLFTNCGITITAQHDGQSKYAVEEWIAHGGPTETDAETLRALLRACLDQDHAGIPVWEEDDTLMMAHPGKSYVLRRSD